MADPQSYRPASGDIPTHPGVYRFRDSHGRVIYVGKAKNLRNRLSSYFVAPERLSPKTYAYGAYCRQRGMDGGWQRAGISTA